jgi:hypothetical protein
MTTDSRRRMRSGTVALGAMGTLALLITSCGGQQPDKRCVDPNTYKVLSDDACRNASSTGSGPHWYYGGSGTQRAKGGSFDEHAVSRGGFGRSGSGGS